MAVTIMIGAARGIHSALLKPYGLRRERERERERERCLYSEEFYPGVTRVIFCNTYIFNSITQLLSVFKFGFLSSCMMYL
jgi:hypothetical protein